MSYTALYRKFRPRSFADVKGQDHIVTTLKNQIKSDRIGHAYLFCGTRGTGKTTVAKIFARAVNCEEPVDGSPCGQCPTCRAIADGSALNVIEIDAASNNGVDNVREIIDEVSYSPTRGRFKVYIIDEVHMLSAGAFNALLKTLEEPPKYVIFILATTEPHRLLVTIQSRCQRYDFHRITIDTIQARLREVVDAENLPVEDKALRYIAKAGDGSMRDALSLLDQCIAFHYGETLSYDMALDVLGAVDTGVFDRMLNSVYDSDVVTTLRLLQECVDQGRDLSQFNTDFIWYIRNVMLIKTDPDLENIIDLNSEDMARLKTTASKLSTEAVLRYINILSELTSQLRYSGQKRILLEVTLIRMCRPQMDSDPISVTERIRVVEDRLENGGIGDSERAASERELEDLKDRVQDIADRLAAGAAGASPEILKKPELPKALPEDVRELNNRWNDVLKAVGIPQAGYLERAVRTVSNDNKLMLVWEESDFAFANANTDESLAKLSAAIEKVIGKQVDVIMRTDKDRRTIRSTYPDISAMVQAMDVVVEEETAEGFADYKNNEGDN